MIGGNQGFPGNLQSVSIIAGDYSELASDYSQYRPDYSDSVLSALIGLLGKLPSEIEFVDVGAGTGIWTRMVYGRGMRSVIAIEPNAAMRLRGVADSKGMAIQWLEGGAETTGLCSSCCDWISMASSFHWVDFDRSIREFWRVLRPYGRFTALWNPRLIEINPLLVEIEAHLDTLRPGIKRVSS